MEINSGGQVVRKSKLVSDTRNCDSETIVDTHEYWPAHGPKRELIVVV